MLLFDSSCLPVSDWRLEVCRYTWTWRNRLLGTLPYVQESNLILIHFRFNSCWRLNSVGTDQINYPIHLLAAAGKPPNSGLWIIGRRSPSIRVSGTVHKCRLLRWPMRCEERGVDKFECPSASVLYHYPSLKIDRSHLKKEFHCHAFTVLAGALSPLAGSTASFQGLPHTTRYGQETNDVLHTSAS